MCGSSVIVAAPTLTARPLSVRCCWIRVMVAPSPVAAGPVAAGPAATRTNSSIVVARVDGVTRALAGQEGHR